ncbi:unnamed protein product [Brassica oleracea var. botrytis]|uniref:(rape) hypothetical protein n=1 Tax=Brassica napus TaxID=3708 RepID=A0A816Q7I9_BRANA|nr:unnamed protein product [Brassica napus]
MKRKRDDPDKPCGHSRFTPADKPNVVSSDNKQDELNDNKSIPATVNPSVPIQSIFHCLFQDLRHRQISNITRSHDQQTSLKPSTPINKRKCVLGLDLMSNQFDGTPAQRSCVTEFACELEFFNFNFQKFKYIPKEDEDSSNQTFEATIDGSLTDVSEDDEMSATYDSDYGGCKCVHM